VPEASEFISTKACDDFTAFWTIDKQSMPLITAAGNAMSYSPQMSNWNIMTQFYPINQYDFENIIKHLRPAT